MPPTLLLRLQRYNKHFKPARNMKENKYPTIEIHLPVRVECPSTRRLGRLWQRILSRMGLLQIRYSGMTPLGLLELVDDKLSRSIYKTSIDSIYQEPEIKIIKSHQLKSETEEIIRFEVYRGKQSAVRVTWHLKWSGAELVIVAAGPTPIVYPIIDDTYRYAYYLISNVS